MIAYLNLLIKFNEIHKAFKWLFYCGIFVTRQLLNVFKLALDWDCYNAKNEMFLLLEFVIHNRNFIIYIKLAFNIPRPRGIIRLIHSSLVKFSSDNWEVISSFLNQWTVLSIYSQPKNTSFQTIHLRLNNDNLSSTQQR